MQSFMSFLAITTTQHTRLGGTHSNSRNVALLFVFVLHAKYVVVVCTLRGTGYCVCCDCVGFAGGGQCGDERLRRRCGRARVPDTDSRELLIH